MFVPNLVYKAPSVPVPTGLYQRALGERWCRVLPQVRRMHAACQRVTARGVFRIRHGRRPAAIIARLSRLPKPGQGIPVHLIIEPRKTGERWHRYVGASRLISHQWWAGEDCIWERIGLLCLRFHLHIEHGCLHYAQISASLGFRRLRIPLPSWLAPRVSASEKPSIIEGFNEIRVKVSLPFIGLLIQYEGLICPEV